MTIPNNPPKIARGNSGTLPVLQYGELAFTQDTGQLWVGTESGVNRLVGGPGSSANAIGDLDANAAGAKGITLQTATGTLYMQSASATAPGLVNTGTQTFAGVKTFSSTITGSVSGSAASFTGSLAGDVTGTQGATAVAQVGGSTAANVHAAELLANAATNANTASAVVKRDASGNFSAGTITASVTGAASLNVLSSAVNAANGVCPLDASSKVPAANLPSVVFQFQGAWNPNTNTPTLSDASGTAGYVYYVSAAKSGAVSGLADSSMSNFQIGDLAIFSAASGKWELSSPAAGVQSVNGAQGSVSVNAINQLTGDVTAGPASGSASAAATVVKINGTSLAGLATGLLKNTTTTGVPSIATSGTDYSAGTSALATGILKSTTTTGALTIAVAGDFPTLNQNTTGTAAKPGTGSAHGAVTLDSSGAFQSIAPGSAGNYVRSNGTDYVQSTIQAGDVPTLNQATTANAGTATAPATGSAHGAVALDSSGNFKSVAPGSNGNVLQSNGTDWVSAAPGAATYTAPTVQKFTAAPTGATNYAFTITSHAFIKGDTYTNNGATFTVVSASATSTTVIMSGTGTPAASGTLTWASGSGSGNITFSAFTGAYVAPTSPAPLYLKVRLVGGGGGGGAGGTAGGGAAGAGTATTLSAGSASAGGGAAGTNLGGTVSAGGTNSLTTSASIIQLASVAGAYGIGGNAGAASSTEYGQGGDGGNSIFGGAGGGGANQAGTAAAANSGSGGAGGGGNATATVAGGGGGGAGGYLEYIVTSPAATYTYTVGGGGAAASLGTNGFSGGAGAAGIIIVEECYQ